ncbi:Putative insulin receptor tyrosine kinase substrate-like protein, partial [Gryllus bimaculatus]
MERTGVGRSGACKGKAERGKADLGKSERSKGERAKVERAKAERTKAERTKAERGKAERGKAERGKAERGKAERGKTERGKAERVETERVGDKKDFKGSERSALTQVVEVYKEIQNQQMNILKAFYVDLLVPLETNLEKDTKVVQSEQKRFLQQHKQRSETYSKAAAAIKKQRKKSKGASKTGIAMDKELKNMQVLEEEKSKLDAFCEQSLKTYPLDPLYADSRSATVVERELLSQAMTQERRRYGFVLERQCSLAKHYLAYHTLGSSTLQRHLDGWQDVAGTREFLPEAIES